MRDHVPSVRVRRRWAASLLVLCLAVVGCSATAATPVPSASRRPVSTPTPPIICDDGPNAHTPMSADCVIPGYSGLIEAPSLILPATDVPTPRPTYGLPAGLATLPPAVQWHGRTVYSPPAGSGAMLIGIGPDDTLYVLVERSLAVTKPTPKNGYVVPDIAASVIALLPDGSVRRGWPSGGVHVAGNPLSFKVNSEGTVFVASGRNPYSTSGGTFSPSDFSRLTITAIGTDGHVLPGWPYMSPASLQIYDPEVLVLGPHGTVCFLNEKPGVLPSGGPRPELIYCLGADGKLLPGWPVAGDSMFLPAVGPDGTVYVGRVTSTKTDSNAYVYPYQIEALGIDGQPKPGWVPWTPSPLVGLTAIQPLANGRVRVLLGGDGGNARLVDLDSTGKVLDDHPELEGMVRSPNYKDHVVSGNGDFLVALTEQDGDGDYVNAYASDGSQKPGWPRLVGGWGEVAVGSDGTVAIAWTVFASSGGGADTGGVALFDSSGNLAPGYPVACNRLLSYSSYGLSVASDGTAYGTMATATGAKIVAFGR